MNFLFILLLSLSAAHSETVYNDREISAILMEANDADISSSKIALKRSKNSEVKAFADEMIKDHVQANHDLQRAMEKANITTIKSNKSADIKTTKKDTRKNLKSLMGIDFDKAYAENEVVVHTQILNSLDQDLIPNAKSPNLKDYLSKTRTSISAHLEHAKHLQS